MGNQVRNPAETGEQQGAGSAAAQKTHFGARWVGSGPGMGWDEDHEREGEWRRDGGNGPANLLRAQPAWST